MSSYFQEESGLSVDLAGSIPAQIREKWKWLLVVAAVVVLFVLLSLLRGFYTDWLWFGELGFRGVYIKVLVTRVALFLAWGGIFGVLAGVSLYFAYRLSAGAEESPLPQATADFPAAPDLLGHDSRRRCPQRSVRRLRGCRLGAVPQVLECRRLRRDRSRLQPGRVVLRLQPAPVRVRPRMALQRRDSDPDSDGCPVLRAVQLPGSRLRVHPGAQGSRIDHSRGHIPDPGGRPLARPLGPRTVGPGRRIRRSLRRHQRAQSALLIPDRGRRGCRRSDGGERLHARRAARGRGSGAVARAADRSAARLAQDDAAVDGQSERVRQGARVHRPEHRLHAPRLRPLWSERPPLPGLPRAFGAVDSRQPADRGQHPAVGPRPAPERVPADPADTALLRLRGRRRRPVHRGRRVPAGHAGRPGRLRRKSSRATRRRGSTRSCGSPMASAWP